MKARARRTIQPVATMSLMASAHSRMRKKREKEKILSPSNGNATSPTNVSPRNNASGAGKEVSPSGAGGGRGDKKLSPTMSAALSAFPFDVIPPTSNVLSPTNKVSPTNAAPPSSPVIATLNGVQKPYHSSIGELPPIQQQRRVPPDPMPTQQQHVSQKQKQQQREQQQQQPQHSPTFHPQRPPIPSRRPYGIGINSLDSSGASGEYLVENSGPPPWNQHQLPQPQQPYPLGASPALSPEFHGTALRHDSPLQPYPLQQLPLNPPPQSMGMLDAATRYQGNYTNYLSPRRPQQVPSRPRRRYDSFEQAPENAEEEEDDELLQHQQKQQHQQQKQQQQQAFDPFAPSPLTIGAPVGGSSNAADVHSAHRASPLFQNAVFPPDGLSNSLGPSGSVLGVMGGMGGGLHVGGGIGANSETKNEMNREAKGTDNNACGPKLNSNINNKNGNPQLPIAPENSDPNNPAPAGALTTINSSRLGDFVYDPDLSVEEYNHAIERSEDSRALVGPRGGEKAFARQELEEYHDEDDGEIVDSDQGSRFLKGHDEGEGGGGHPPSQSSGEGGPLPLRNDYDFEYHTEKDEGSALFDAGEGATGEEPAAAPYEKEGRDHPAPFRLGVDVGENVDDHDVSRIALITNAVDPRFQSGIGGGLRASPPDMDSTTDSERALDGTMPSKRKKETLKKKRRGHRARIIIDNVGRAGGGAADERFARSNTEGAVHRLEEETNSMGPASDEGIHEDGHRYQQEGGAPPHIGSSISGRDNDSIGGARTKPGRIRGGDDEPFFPTNSNMDGDDLVDDGLVRSADLRFFSLPRVAGSKSWDCHPVDVENNGEDNNDGNGNDDRDAGARQKQQGRVMRESKSWGEDSNNEMLYPAVNESIPTWGTWGDNTTSLFGGTAGAGSVGGEGGVGAGSSNARDDPFSSDKENLFQRRAQQEKMFERQDDEVNARALAEWDKAEAEWREKSVVEDVSVEKADQVLPSSFFDVSLELSPERQARLLSPPKKLEHPWKSSITPKVSKEGLAQFNPLEEAIPAGGSMGIDVFSEPTRVGDKGPAPRVSEQAKLPPEEDEDSIFEFETKGSLLSRKSESKKQTASTPASVPQAPSNPADIFSKINSSLEMASKTKNRALGIEADLSNERDANTDNDETRVREEATLTAAQESSTSQASNIDVLAAAQGYKSNNRGSGKRIAFAAGAPQVHTYLAPEESSELDKEYTYSGAEEDEDSCTDASDEDVVRGIGNNMMDGTAQRETSDDIQKMGNSRSGTIGTVEGDSLLQEQEGSDNDTYGDSTLGDSTYNDPTNGADDLMNDALKKGEQKQGDDDWALMDQVDNAVTLVATSLGGLFGIASPAAASTSAKNGPSHDEGVGGGNRDAGSLLMEEKSLETEVDNGTHGESTIQSTVQSTQYTEQTGNSEYDWLGYMRNILFPTEGEAGSVASGRSGTIGSARTPYSGTYEGGTYDGDDSTYGAEDEDSYLLQQALAAARAIHHIQGVEYDEAQEINVLSDIKFVVVTVSLPLGCECHVPCHILFLFNYLCISNLKFYISNASKCSSKNMR